MARRGQEGPTWATLPGFLHEAWSSLLKSGPCVCGYPHGAKPLGSDGQAPVPRMQREGSPEVSASNTNHEGPAGGLPSVPMSGPKAPRSPDPRGTHPSPPGRTLAPPKPTPPCGHLLGRWLPGPPSCSPTRLGGNLPSPLLPNLFHQPDLSHHFLNTSIPFAASGPPLNTHHLLVSPEGFRGLLPGRPAPLCPRPPFPHHSHSCRGLLKV